MLTNTSILITGGTGSFGHTFVPMTLAKYNPRSLVLYYTLRTWIEINNNKIGKI
jgi:FlaA1/EpsC-like NDP-sugar epimerase